MKMFNVINQIISQMVCIIDGHTFHKSKNIYVSADSLISMKKCSRCKRYVMFSVFTGHFVVPKKYENHLKRTLEIWKG